MFGHKIQAAAAAVLLPRLLPNREEFLCLDANNGLTFGLFLPPAVLAGSLAAEAVAAEAVGGADVELGCCCSCIELAWLVSLLFPAPLAMAAGIDAAVAAAACAATGSFFSIELSSIGPLALSSAESMAAELSSPLLRPSFSGLAGPLTIDIGSAWSATAIAMPALLVPFPLAAAPVDSAGWLVAALAPASPLGLLLGLLRKGSLGFGEARCAPNKLGFWEAAAAAAALLDCSWPAAA